MTIHKNTLTDIYSFIAVKIEIATRAIQWLFLHVTRKMEFISVENFRIDILDYLRAYIFHTIRVVLNAAFTIRFHILISESLNLFRVKAGI